MSAERAAQRERVTPTWGRMVGHGGGEGGTEPGQEIDFPGLAGNGDTRSPIVSPH